MGLLGTQPRNGLPTASSSTLHPRGTATSAFGRVDWIRRANPPACLSRWRISTHCKTRPPWCLSKLWTCSSPAARYWSAWAIRREISGASKFPSKRSNIMARQLADARDSDQSPPVAQADSLRLEFLHLFASRIGLVERAFKPAMPAFMRAFLVAQAFLPVYRRLIVCDSASLPATGPSSKTDPPLQVLLTGRTACPHTAGNTAEAGGVDVTVGVAELRC
jgi:hypothetical protein